MEDEIRSFPDKRRLKRINLHQMALHNMRKGLLQEEEEKELETEEHKYKGGKMNMYLSIITLNLNGLNAPNKRYRVAECITKQDLHIC